MQPHPTSLNHELTRIFTNKKRNGQTTHTAASLLFILLVKIRVHSWFKSSPAHGFPHTPTAEPRDGAMNRTLLLSHSRAFASIRGSNLPLRPFPLHPGIPIPKHKNGAMNRTLLLCLPPLYLISENSCPFVVQIFPCARVSPHAHGRAQGRCDESHPTPFPFACIRVHSRFESSPARGLAARSFPLENTVNCALQRMVPWYTLDVLWEGF